MKKTSYRKALGKEEALHKGWFIILVLGVIGLFLTILFKVI